KHVATKHVDEPRPEPTPKSTGTNDLLSFLNFVEHHKPGSSVNAIVENYSSHGAYVRIGEVKGYVPLSLMSDPAPRSAREFMKIGESITLVVESFAPARRSIDLAIPTMATIKTPPAEIVIAPKPKRSRKAAAKAPAPVEVEVEVELEGDTTDVIEPPAPRKRASKKAVASVAPQTKPKARTRKAAAVATPVSEPAVVESPPVVDQTVKPARKRAAPKTPVTKAAAPVVVVEPAVPVKPTRRRTKSA
ncbi:MAG: S1 RNA-binding domain-containing protein, partial [Ilumatobacteraceae bacterium]